MSTRGCVAVGIPLKWEGIYNHYDSYPGGLGLDLWHILLHEKDLKDFAARLLRCDSWPAFLAAEIGPEDNYDGRLDCAHITNEDADPLFIEWVYIIDPERNMLHVLKHESVGNRLDFSKRSIGPVKLTGRVVDYGHCAFKHVLVASLKLDGPEPDWGRLGHENKLEED